MIFPDESEKVHSLKKKLKKVTWACVVRIVKIQNTIKNRAIYKQRLYIIKHNKIWDYLFVRPACFETIWSHNLAFISLKTSKNLHNLLTNVLYLVFKGSFPNPIEIN